MPQRNRKETSTAPTTIINLPVSLVVEIMSTWSKVEALEIHLLYFGIAAFSCWYGATICESIGEHSLTAPSMIIKV